MPIPREMLDEVTANIDGEGDVDPIIQQQVADDRAGRRRRDLPEDFLRRVMVAQEYAMHHQGLEEDECCRRRGYVNEWLDSLREGDRYDHWCERLRWTTRELTPEEQAAEDAKAAVRAAERKVADERAEALLRSALSPKQLKELDRRGYFHVVVAERRFRITRGRSHNIKEVDRRGRILRTLCAHPVEAVPNADTMLAQKFWLETKPEDFFKIANVIRVERRRPLRGSRQGIGPAVVNTRNIDRLVMDRVAEQVAAQAHRMQAFFNEPPRETPEQQARREWQAAEEDMAILEQAARETTPGVEPAPAQPTLEPPAATRAA